MEIKQTFISISLDTGRVAIMGFVTQGKGSILPSGAIWIDEEKNWWYREPTDENIKNEIERTMFSNGQPTIYRIISQEEIPIDRTFRDALFDDGQKLMFNMERAREIHRDRLRRLRVAEFEKNDIELRDASLEKDEIKLQKALEKRDVLRNITIHPEIDAAKNIEELKIAGLSVLEE